MCSNISWHDLKQSILAVDVMSHDITILAALPQAIIPYRTREFIKL